MSKTTSMPNVRKMSIPDPGMTIFDVDLAGADAQVVAAEAQDEDLLLAFKQGLDVHDKNARDLWGSAYTSLPGDKHSGPRSKRRKETKQAVHATNYGGSPRNLAKILGWTVRETEDFQRRWFSIHPGIKTNFHGGVERSICTSRMVVNRSGYRRVYFDRIEFVLHSKLSLGSRNRPFAEVSFRARIESPSFVSLVEMLLRYMTASCSKSNTKMKIVSTRFERDFDTLSRIRSR